MTEQEGRPTPTTELAEYHPETGHLHTCTALTANTTDLVARCVCAARLYCVAQDAERPTYTRQQLVDLWGRLDEPRVITFARALGVEATDG